MSDSHDHYWMQQAIALAEQAAVKNEVPVGAVLVVDNKLISTGSNSPITDIDPTAHAEIVAMRNAAIHLNNYRLLNTTLYVTLEPCVMCAGAMVHARIQRLVFGAYDPKAGAISSQAQVLDKPFFNHKVQYQGGILSEHCGMLLSKFFQVRR